jgi:hypothetical protein
MSIPQSWRRRYFVLRSNKMIEYFEYAGDGSDQNIVDRAGMLLPGKGNPMLFFPSACHLAFLFDA